MPNETGKAKAERFPAGRQKGGVTPALSRRTVLGSGVAGGLLTAAAAVAADATFGNPDKPAEGAINVTNPKALTDPGPQDPNLARNDTDLMYMEVFRADRFEEVLLSDWLAHSPIDMVAETLNLDPSVIAQFPKNRPAVVPI
jgi:hypothetical protein